MFRRILMVLLFFVPCGVMADDTNVMALQLRDKLKQDLENAKNGVFADADARAYVKRLEKFKDEDSAVFQLAYFSEKLLLNFEMDFLEMMQQKSKETGREIKYSSESFKGGVSYEYWLDRGKMDSSECEWDFETRTACTFPDGFEEYRLTYWVYDVGDENRQWNEKISVSFDDAAHNKSNTLSISMVSDDSKSVDNRMYNIRVTISGTEYEYNRWYAWQNQEVEDIRNGKYIRCTENCEAKGPFAGIEWKMDISKDWASNIIPGGPFVHAIFNASVAGYLE